MVVGGGGRPPRPGKRTIRRDEHLRECNLGSVDSARWWEKSLESLGDTNLREITIPREVEAGKLRKSRINVHGHICSGVGSAAIQVVLPVKNKVK